MLCVKELRAVIGWGDDLKKSIEKAHALIGSPGWEELDLRNAVVVFEFRKITVKVDKYSSLDKLYEAALAALFNGEVRTVGPFPGVEPG